MIEHLLPHKSSHNSAAYQHLLISLNYVCEKIIIANSHPGQLVHSFPKFNTLKGYVISKFQFFNMRSS